MEGREALVCEDGKSDLLTFWMQGLPDKGQSCWSITRTMYEQDVVVKVERIIDECMGWRISLSIADQDLSVQTLPKLLHFLQQHVVFINLHSPIMSNHEAYVPGNATAISVPGGNSFNTEPVNKPTTYLCGDCGAKVPIRRGDAIRCKECGYRVLYKERTNR